MNAIEVKNLTKSYKEFTLDDVSLTLHGGCIMGLIGENGAGKSTFIKSVLGIVCPDRGDIRIFGKEVGADVKQDIGVVLDEAGIPNEFGVKDVNRVMKNVYKNWDEKKFFEFVDHFGLPEKRTFAKYSKGMKMQLSMAVALSHNANLLILDEPTSGLDPVVRDTIVDILNDFTRDETHSILISSHIVSDLEKLCDYIAFIHKGKLTLCEEKDILLEQYGILNTSEEKIAELDSTAVVSKRVNRWGVEALVRKDKIPQSFEIQPITIEELFVVMAKEEK